MAANNQSLARLELARGCSNWDRLAGGGMDMDGRIMGRGWCCGRRRAIWARGSTTREEVLDAYSIVYFLFQEASVCCFAASRPIPMTNANAVLRDVTNRKRSASERPRQGDYYYIILLVRGCRPTVYVPYGTTCSFVPLVHTRVRTLMHIMRACPGGASEVI
jgi:hypothetical protein